METVLQLLKIDLGISHNVRDAFFTALLLSSQKELEQKGIPLELTRIEDQILLSDYSAWVYRKRTENIPLSQNLQFRIRNRVVKERAKYVRN